MVGGSRGGIWIWFLLSERAANSGVIGGSRWWAVVGSGTGSERGGISDIISSSVDEEVVACRTSLGLGLWSHSLEGDFGVTSARESVLGGEDRSTLGPASDIRGRIRALVGTGPRWKRDI